MKLHSFPVRDSSLSPPRPLRTQKPQPPANLNIPAYLASTHRPLTNQSASPVKRKPLPPNASPSFSPKFSATASSLDGSPRDSIDSRIEPLSARTEDSNPDLVFRDLDKFPRGQSPVPPRSKTLPKRPLHDSRRTHVHPLHAQESAETSPGHSRLISEPSNQTSVGNVSPARLRSSTMALQPSSRPPTLRLDSIIRKNSGSDKKPLTPGNKISSFFSWKNAAISPSAESSETETSDNGHSPLPSPAGHSPQTSAHSSRSAPTRTDKAHGKYDANEYNIINVNGHAQDSDIAAKMGQLEGELKEITSELAGSIRREMDLEDMVERFQAEANRDPNTNDRTSDYFSDSGTSTSRLGPGDAINRHEEIEKIKRDAEQQRAQLRLDLSQKWQDEREKWKALASHVHILTDQVSDSRRGQMEASNATSKARELETALDDVRRRLAEERQIKENFEDLLTGLRFELEQHRGERDNLRDEVIPHLRSQIDGLEHSASTSQREKYDVARMQDEIHALRSENAALQQARRIQQEMQHNAVRINSIAEEGGVVPEHRMSMTRGSMIGLSRSNSVAQSRGSSRAGLVRSGSLSRSNSIGGNGLRSPLESKETIADKVKDIEFQRDALHSAMKALLTRQDHQARDNERRIRALEAERDKALQSGSPRRQGYEREVRNMRAEINHLRQRADEAFSQKWHCEKGLGGLVMDLDRSKQETSGLRQALQGHDMTVPEELSISLHQAYQQLQQEQRQVAETSRGLAEEKKLALELTASTERSEALAMQVRQQMHTNSTLRDRLAHAIGRGEQYQSESEDQINELQNKLRRLEDTVMTAQAQSETSVMRHEEEMRILQDSHNAQLMRMKNSLRTTNVTGAQRSPLSPMFANSKRSPRLDQTSSGPGMPLQQVLKTEYLENKVGDLEKALREADKEMEQVVQRMNQAQIEVGELQSERDEALRQTRRLQQAILNERQTVQALMSQ